MEKYHSNSAPFIYCIFDQSDREEAMSVMSLLDENGYKLSYEEKKYEDCIGRAAAVLLFVSDAMMNDRSLNEEVSYASLKNKEIISVFLEDCQLTPGLSMMLGQTQGVLKYRISEEEFRKSLLNSPLLNDLQITAEQKKAARKQTTLAGLAIGALVLIGLFILILNPFRSSDSLLGQLGISGNLSEIRKVYVYGEELKEDYVIADFILTEDGFNDLVSLEDSTVATGHIEDISDFSKLVNLEELCLCANEIRSIEAILGLDKLRLLDISHNYGIDIRGISALQSLEVLNIAETEIEDISELGQLKDLKTLYVSADYLVNQAEAISGFPFEVRSINEPVYSFEELKSALNKEDVHNIKILSSITIPENETIIIRNGVLLGGGPLGNGEEITVDNYGTLIIEGGFEMGMCRRNNYGTIIVRNGGVYTGGMCDSYTYGSFVIEEDGIQNEERGHVFVIGGGEYVNNGKLVLRGGGEFRFNDGQFINNGDIIWNKGDFGPQFRLDAANYVNNGHIYYRDYSGEDPMNPSGNDEITGEHREIAIGEVNGLN